MKARNCLLFSVMMVICAGGVAQRFGKTLKQTPGIVSYTFRKSFQKDVAATLDTIKSMGITNIEFSNLFGRTPDEIRKLLDEKGMKCTSYGVSYGEILNKITEVGAYAKILGAEFVRVASIPRDGKPLDVELTKKAVDDFNRSGKILKEQFNLLFCYHNHGYEFVPYDQGTLFDYLMEHTDPKYVNFEIDILWVAHPGKDPVELLEKYGKRFKLMHVKDLRKGVVGDFSGGTPVENDVILGTGQINIPAVLKAARKSGIQYYYIEDESTAAKFQVPQSLLYLKKL